MANKPFDTNLFDKAAQFAINAHHCTERRGKSSPYIIHCMEAASIVESITNDQEILAAAILHDTVEDTEITLEQIRAEFGEYPAHQKIDRKAERRGKDLSRYLENNKHQKYQGAVIPHESVEAAPV